MTHTGVTVPIAVRFWQILRERSVVIIRSSTHLFLIILKYPKDVLCTSNFQGAYTQSSAVTGSHLLMWYTFSAGGMAMC